MLKRSFSKVKTSIIFLASMIIFNVMAFSVSAQVDLIKIFEPFRGFDIGALYANPAFRPFINFVLYLIFFIGVTQFALGKRFQGKGAGAIKTTLGIMLAVALVFWERSPKGVYILERMGPIVALIFLLFLAYVVFYLISHFGMGKPYAIAIALLVAYYSARAVVPTVFDPIEKNTYLGSIIAIGLFVLWIMLIWGIIRAIINYAKGGRGFLGGTRGLPPVGPPGGGPGGQGPPGTGPPGTGPPGGGGKRTKEETQAQRALEKALDLERRMNQISQGLGKLSKIEEGFAQQIAVHYKELEGLLYELLNVVRGAWQAQRAIRQNLAEFRKNPQYSEQYATEANEQFKQYDELVQRVFDLLNKIDGVVANLNRWFNTEADNIVKDERELERKEFICERRSGHKFSQALKYLKDVAKYNNLNIKDEYKVAVSKLDQEIKTEIKGLIVMYERMFEIVKELKAETANLRNIYNEIRGLNRGVLKMIKSVTSRVTGLSRGVPIIDGWRPVDIQRYIHYGVGPKFMWLREEDIRNLWRGLEKVLGNMQLSIDRNIKSPPLIEKKDALDKKMLDLQHEIEALEIDLIKKIVKEKQVEVNLESTSKKIFEKEWGKRQKEWEQKLKGREGWIGAPGGGIVPPK